MIHIEGRGIRQPVVAEVFMGEQLVLRIDDQKNPATWLTLAFTPEEFGSLMDRYCQWLFHSEQPDALNRLMFKKD